MSSLKQSLDQKLLHKLSPQQIQFIKLLQLNTFELEQKIEEELLENPGIETNDEFEEEDKEVGENEITSIDDDLKVTSELEPPKKEEDIDSYDDQGEAEEYAEKEEELFDISDYTSDDGDEDGFHLYEESDNQDEERKEMPIAVSSTFHETLIEQFEAIAKNEKELLLGLQIIGSLDDDGYLHRGIDAIVNDLLFGQNIETDVVELEKILHKIQQLDPAGIAARNLQECLLLQLQRKDAKDEHVALATKIIKNYCDEFVKKHYDKLCKSLKITEEHLKKAIEVIVKLTPKPGEQEFNTKSNYIIPDFTVINNNGHIEVTLNSRNMPDLRVSRSYMDTLKSYEKNPTNNKQIKDSVQFIKQKIDSAKWFIDSIRQRQETLLKTMKAIVAHQKKFFLDGEEVSLRPMILKNIADAISMDISTISRVANSKFVETEFGTFSLKFFFSEGVANEDGEEVSNKEIKKILSNCIEAENKSKPLPDEALMEILKEKGYNIARRTVAKYREQLGIPVARLRKEMK